MCDRLRWGQQAGGRVVGGGVDGVELVRFCVLWGGTGRTDGMLT